MASTALNDINKLTPDNLAIRELSELLFLEILKTGALNEILTLNYGVLNGQHVGGIGEFGLVGESMKMCNPVFNNTNLGTQEKIWELGILAIAEELCADDFEETVARFAMQTGTNRADLTQTDLLNDIVEPRLRQAVEKAIWRVVWFGDKDAEKAPTGVITASIDVKYFNMTDGLFKRLFQITSANADQHVTIAANTAATYAAQRSDIKNANIATGIFDDLIYNADPILRQADDRFILCTQSMADALAIDLKANNKGSELQWQSLFNGLVFVTEYNGERVIRIPMWDAMIKSYEDNGTTLNKPHRALYTTKSNLWAGFESQDSLPTLKIWFSDDDQSNKIIARDKVGTLVWDDRLIQFAY